MKKGTEEQDEEVSEIKQDMVEEHKCMMSCEAAKGMERNKVKSRKCTKVRSRI